MDTYTPKTTIRTNERKKPIWMDQTSYRATKKKQSEWVKHLNTKHNEEGYRRARNNSSHATRDSRRNFERKLAHECRKNTKGVWKYIKSQMRRSKTIPDLKKPDGSLTSDDKEASEVLSQQYYLVFTNENTTNLPSFDQKTLVTEPLSGFNITRDRVLKKLKSLKPDKSPGDDGFHPRVMREIAEVLSYPLTHIYQKSVETSELPNQWREATITPIYKKGSRNLAENYRPVSLTSMVCKTIEDLVAEDITLHVKANSQGCKEQHGFSKGKSVTTNLIEALNIWTEALSHNIPVDVIFLDYQKAFDRVPHQRLIKQIESFGITDKAIKWIAAFLNNRKQRVRANTKISEWKPVLSGIPQGSILGPILFILFVNDVPGLINAFVEMFADDTKLFAFLLSEFSPAMLQTDLGLLEDWTKLMQMSFHPDKCKVMHLGHNNPHKDYHLHHPDGTIHILEKVSEEKDLGVTIDDKLKFSQHVQNKVNIANKVLGCLPHTFKNMTKEILSLLYKAMVRPHLEFATTVWSPHLKYDQDLIERVQRRATKLVPELRDLPYSQRLQALNLPTLSFRRKRADILEAYRILTGIHKIDMDTHCTCCEEKLMFKPTLLNSTRGHECKQQIQREHGVRNHFFPARVTKLWNHLQNETVKSENINTFKSRLQKEFTNSDLFDYNFSY